MITHHVASRIEGRSRRQLLTTITAKGREGLEGRDPTSAIYVFSPARVIYVYGQSLDWNSYIADMISRPSRPLRPELACRGQLVAKTEPCPRVNPLPHALNLPHPVLGVGVVH